MATETDGWAYSPTASPKIEPCQPTSLASPPAIDAHSNLAGGTGAENARGYFVNGGHYDEENLNKADNAYIKI